MWSMDPQQQIPDTPNRVLDVLEHQRLIALINSMADGVLATDETATIVMSNGAALNILDVNDSLLNKNLAAVFKIVDRNNQNVNFQDIVLQTKTPLTNRDWRLEYADGSFINLYISIAPVRLGFGVEGQRGYVILLRDITHEKSLEEERDEFISVVSHELRTPIAISEGNVSNALVVAEKEHVPDAVVKALNVTHEQIMFLANMINDLSTLSRAERNKLEVTLEQINVHELVDGLVADYTPQAAKKNLTLTAHQDPSLALLTSSKLYVREILQNFITNAIKYTETGSITISANQRPNGVLFEVSDTGIGISKSDQEKVFDKFFRSEDFRTRQSNGTGLGLYVTMKLARLVHAEIELHSELNKGSTFTILIPNMEAVSQATEPAAIPSVAAPSPPLSTPTPSPAVPTPSPAPTAPTSPPSASPAAPAPHA